MIRITQKINQDNVDRFLRAVLRAETYIKSNRANAQEIVANRIGADPFIVRSIWDAFIFEITLDQSILVGLEDEAKWAIDIGAFKKSAPNYLNFIDFSSLRDQKPEAVNIFH